MNAKPFEVRMLTPARRDLLELKQFIQKDRPLTAKKVLEKTLHDIAVLENLPEIGMPILDARLRNMGYHYWPVLDGKYIVFYVIYSDKNQVQVRRILSARQDYLPILQGKS